jgi:hypothetical protein
LYCAGLRHANVHNTLELANTSIGFRTRDGRFFLAVAAVVFDFVSCFDAPSLMGSLGLGGTSSVFLNAYPAGIEMFAGVAITAEPSGLNATPNPSGINLATI